MIRDNVRAFRWEKNKGRRRLFILDQLRLPREVKWISCLTHKDVARCIRNMNVRGAPAIGCVAAYGLALAVREKNFRTEEDRVSYCKAAAKTLASTRPTAVNLFWAIQRMMERVMGMECSCGCKKGKVPSLCAILEEEADMIYYEDLSGNYSMGKLGAKLFPRNAVILTHCNTGSLATSGWGTALGVVRTAYQQGKIKKVLVDETRPYLQGARLTAWELSQDKIPYELITDNMAAHMMKTEKVDAVIVGSDRIAANGDVANKIGTYSLAVLCKYHKIPFYVAAPTSTCDLKMQSGFNIPIEERSTREVTHIRNVSHAPRGVVARHPAFDVTPHSLITAIITERGVAKPPSRKTIGKLFERSSRRSSRSRI